MELQQATSMARQRPSTWWDRNWKWFVPTGCLFGLLMACAFIAGILYLVFSLMKSSDAYRQAFARAQHHPAVVSALGEPIKGGLFVSGNINVNGPAGSANLSIPISGPRGRATVYLRATKSMGEWAFDELKVKVEGTGQKIDLLAERTE